MCLRGAVCVIIMLLASSVAYSANEIRVDIYKKSTGDCPGGSETLFFDKDTNFTINISACDDLINIGTTLLPERALGA